jgi:two-component system, cell cycle sensor histidine kinase and response regulator CckA
VLQLAAMILSKYGFRTQTAVDGVEGLERYLRHRHELCAVVTDVVMPRMDGKELARTIREMDPEIPIVLISGYPDTQTETEGREVFPFIRKPFMPSDLVNVIRSVWHT